MFNGSDANLATEGLCRRPGSIPKHDFQSVFAIRRGSCSFQDIRHLSTTEEGLPGSVSCRPISNLTVMSKLLERIVARQLVSYLSENDLLPDRQSAYGALRSTETIIARLLSDILTALDEGDLSAAFDTVDHPILLYRLQTSFGLCGSALAGLSSYLEQRRHYVSVHGKQSAMSDTKFGVPQGSVLRPILFMMCTAVVIRIMERFGLGVHQYAGERCSSFGVPTSRYDHVTT